MLLKKSLSFSFEMFTSIYIILIIWNSINLLENENNNLCYDYLIFLLFFRWMLRLCVAVDWSGKKKDPVFYEIDWLNIYFILQ